MNFIVTGGAGFIGSQIVGHLVKNNHSVMVIDNFHIGKKKNLVSFQDKIKILKMSVPLLWIPCLLLSNRDVS